MEQQDAYLLVFAMPERIEIFEEACGRTFNSHNRTLGAINSNVTDLSYFLPVESARNSQPTFDDLEANLFETTFVVVDLETTGGSNSQDAITEIGAVKIKGGKVIGEFQTLINPQIPIPAFITVLTGITDAMVITAPPIGEALFSFFEFLGSPNETVLVAHNAPFDIGFLKASARNFQISWPNYQILDTVKLARNLLARDEVINFKLASLAAFFKSQTDPSHRALSDARATVDVFHGLLERAGSFGLSTVDDLRSFTHRLTSAQREKRHLAESLPQSPGVYIFRGLKGEALYIGTTRNLKSRVKSYFTSSETRSRVLEMLTLANAIDVIPTPTIIEAEIRELRLIADKKPRFNRRSKFQEKAIWVKLTEDSFPRLSSVRGHANLADEVGWCGPFNGRESAELAIEALYEIARIRQCTPRITLKSMKSASPCALFDMKRCNAPCIGNQSVDSYQTEVSIAKSIMMDDATPLLELAQNRMAALALQERFEEATDLRDRFSALVNGLARGQRIRALSRIAEIITALPSADSIEICIIRFGRLAGSAKSTKQNLKAVIDSLKLTAEMVQPEPGILPASSHEEVEKLLRYIESEEIRLLHIEGDWALPTRSGAALREKLLNAKRGSDQSVYKDRFANSLDSSDQRSRS